MIKKYRSQFNAEYSPEKYKALQQNLAESSGIVPSFKIAESPIFLSQDFKSKLFDVCQSIVSQIEKIPNEELLSAVPENLKVPNDSAKPDFLTIDFGICYDQENNAVPQLIELQAFPSLYAYQRELQNSFIEQYPFLKELKPEISDDAYNEELRKLIIGKENPENVVLLEIYPELQKTNIDFKFTEKKLGIATVCITKVKKKGNQLFYTKDGREILIKRIYNRVIFDELERYPDLELAFDFKENLEVEWITHPNWFFKISKFLLPKLQHQYIPKSYFLSEFPKEENLENFVLKPLFSFAGSGVNLAPTLSDLTAISDPENYILQRKVEYAPLFEDLNGEFSKAEIRVLYIWHRDEDQPKIVEYLVRLTKAAMVNVDFNKKDAIWIGGSTAFFG